VHRKRRPRRRCRGCCCTLTAAVTSGFPDERWYDLIVILDDASSEIYTRNWWRRIHGDGDGGLEVIERKGVFWPLYSDRGSHFWLTPKVGGKVDPHRLTQVGPALRMRCGIRDEIRPAYSPQARGVSERSSRTWQDDCRQQVSQTRDQIGASNASFYANTISPSYNRHFQVRPAQRG